MRKRRSNPIIGDLLGLSGIVFGIWVSGIVFGIWAGVSMFSTGPVVAVGFAHSELAGQWATMSKLARNTLIGVMFEYLDGVNLLGVNLAGLLTLWYIGYRPEEWFEIPTAERHVFKQISILIVVILGLSLFLGSVTYTSYQMSTFEETAIMETEAVLEDHEEAHLLELEVEVHQEGFSLDRSLDATQQIDIVVIEIGGPLGTYDPELIDTLHERINEHTTGEVAVQVRFVTSGHR